MRWDEDRTGFREVSVKKVDVKASQDGGSQWVRQMRGRATQSRLYQVVMTWACPPHCLTTCFWEEKQALLCQPTNHQIKWAGSSVFLCNSLLLCQFWCSQFNFKVLPRNILKGDDYSLNKTADTNITSSFMWNSLLHSPFSLSTGKDISLHLVHSYMNHNTL